MKYIIVINPISGDIDKKNLKIQVKQLFDSKKYDLHIYETRRNDDHQELKDTIKQFYPDRLLICGGDGTFSSLIPILLEFKIPVGFVPLGSANGLAADMQIEGSALKIIKRYMATSKTARMDCLLINQRFPVLHLADIGINANMVKDYDKDPNRGWLTYARYALYHLQRVTNFQVKINNQKDTILSKGVMVGICNGNTFGTTGIKLNKISKIDDGKFEVVVIKALRFSNLISASLSTINEEWYDDENYEIIQSDYVEIELEKPMQLQIDGEIINEFDKITVSVKPKAIEYLVI